MPHARANIKDLMKRLEDENSEIFTSMRSALGNIQDEALFDKERFKI
jgi:Spy/CpxP family protein refolding chaperone